MFFEKDETRSLKELELENERLSNNVEKLLKDLNISSDKLGALLSNPENFTKSNWETLQQIQKDLDEKLNQDLANIANPSKVKKTRESLNPGKNWIFVR